MKSIWLENNALRYRDDIPIPEPPPGEALVAVRLAGICGTDLELVKGYYPYTGIPGHEFVGKIVQSPDHPESIGNRVVGEINVGCGTCEPCLRRQTTHCERRNVLGIMNRNGAFAEYLCLPMVNLITVSDDISDEVAVFVEPLAAALEIQEQIRISPTDRVLVLGAGRLGQLIAQTLILCGCDLKIVARYHKQRELLSRCNIPYIDESDVPERFFDIVVEATGSTGGFALARNAVRPRGTIVLKSTYRGDQQIDLSSVVVDEIVIVGSRCGPFAPALRLIKNRSVDPGLLIDACYSLENGVKAFERAAQPGSLKILLQIVE
jgi:threonine dehydrogenase-like Zn-dependent dehydrogenase